MAANLPLKIPTHKPPADAAVALAQNKVKKIKR
jgi:hypothetical protein